MISQLFRPPVVLDLIEKYNTPVPRYTSYPPATELSKQFSDQDFLQAITASNQRQTPLSLYCHIPFCQSACYFCGCNVVVTNNKAVAKPYLDHLLQEIAQKAALIDTSRPVLQMHWGGGTPNYLELDQIEALWSQIAHYFTFDAGAELSIEINPRYISQETIMSLRQIGFNRISFGIQDFDPQVQAVVNRVQPESLLRDVMSWIRLAGFESVNVDLIYGLPYQTLQTFRQTIAKTIALHPDRIAVFNFAYVPWMKPVQRKIPVDALPTTHEKLEILSMTIDELTHHGYRYIGMDHFAKLGDELAIAQSERTLTRNFQGYTTKPETELFGFGLTSISMLHDAYAQNYKSLKDYYQSVEARVLPISKGIKLSQEDLLRRDVIMHLMSHSQVIKQEINEKYSIDFDRYFAAELGALKPLEQDELVKLSPHLITVTEIGRLLVRNIAVIFDAYHLDRSEKRLSKAI
jgi:oxygen-independent coproporphyrinogen-3 oxidase